MAEELLTDAELCGGLTRSMDKHERAAAGGVDPEANGDASGRHVRLGKAGQG